MTALDFTAIVLCDDIRKEITNKEILIGVYSGDILISTFPQWIRLAIWMEITSNDIGEHPIILRLRVADNPPLAIQVKVQSHAIGTSSIAISGMELLLEKEGEIVLELRDGKDDWRPLKRKIVRQGKASPSSLPVLAPAPPGSSPGNV